MKFISLENEQTGLSFGMDFVKTIRIVMGHGHSERAFV